MLGLGRRPSIAWNFPNQAGHARACVRPGECGRRARRLRRRGLRALKETEQSLSAYGAELDRRQALAMRKTRRKKPSIWRTTSFAPGLDQPRFTHDEQSLISVDAAVAVSDTALVQDQIAVFKALGGGWHDTPRPPNSP